MEWLVERVVLFVPMLLSLAVHEWAHAWTAFRLGDDTAKHMGRMTLDPFAHVDPLGTIALPLLGIPVAWAKPVPVEPLRFRQDVSQRFGLLLVAAAGPLSNLVLALACAGALAVLAGTALAGVLAQTVLLNVMLAAFNLLPVPPLDGSRVVDGVVPDALRPAWDQLQSTGYLGLAVVLVAPVLLGLDLFAWPRAWAEGLVAIAGG
ncbi:MAG: site-2 protease family protein [Myxococcota bacterium]